MNDPGKPATRANISRASGVAPEKVGSRSALWVEPLEGFHADPAYAHTLN
jgi:hypothetical protein